MMEMYHEDADRRARAAQNARVTMAALLTADELRFEECRAHAAECQEIADWWPDPIKYEYNEFARQWLALPEQARCNW
jgi:hypothetical protein